MLSQYPRRRGFLKDKTRQTAADYCVMIVMAAFALLAASPNLSASIQSFFAKTTASLISGFAAVLCLIFLIYRIKHNKAR
jgi:Flp pilus assembly pilin Flp